MTGPCAAGVSRPATVCLHPACRLQDPRSRTTDASSDSQRAPPSAAPPKAWPKAIQPPPNRAPAVASTRVAQTPRGLNLHEGSVHPPSRPQRPARRQPRLPVVFAHARRRIVRISPLPRPAVAAIEADGVSVVAKQLPGRADLDGTASLVLDEGVLALLPVGLELQGQPIRHPVFGEQAQARIASHGRQGRLVAGRIETAIGLQALVFDDGLALSPGLDPGAGLGRLGDAEGQNAPRRRQDQAS